MDNPYQAPVSDVSAETAAEWKRPAFLNFWLWLTLFWMAVLLPYWDYDFLYALTELSGGKKSGYAWVHFSSFAGIIGFVALVPLGGIFVVAVMKYRKWGFWGLWALLFYANTIGENYYCLMAWSARINGFLLIILTGLLFVGGKNRTWLRMK
jgi:hypothetical protein